jgi:hypothetical protein
MRKKNYYRKARKKTGEIQDIEVAKKMIKIHQSAEDRKLEFNLSFETVKNLLLEPTCFYTGKVFEETGIFSRSFDRIDSSLGYIEGNVVACTVDINTKKSNLTLKEIELIYQKLSSPKENIPPQIEDPIENRPLDSI